MVSEQKCGVMYSVSYIICLMCVFFFKQKTAYEMRISDWSSDVCSSDLSDPAPAIGWYVQVRLPGSPRPTMFLPWAGMTTSPDDKTMPLPGQIGRASCRERVCQYV